VAPVFVKQLFPNFEDVYGDGDGDGDEFEDGFETVRVIFGSDYDKSPPKMTINKEGFAVTGSATLRIMNPINSALEAAIIYTDFDFSAKAKMEAGNKITGLLNGLTLTVTGLKPLFESEETIDTISAKMKGAQQLIIAGMNKFLEEGIEIPLPEYMKKDF
jgi:hypothetical protein